ncbi:Uncharacterised protein [Vibrio cholerae]|nr:Uncharacterised protein [Vibrio cholerae]
MLLPVVDSSIFPHKGSCIVRAKPTAEMPCRWRPTVARIECADLKNTHPVGVSFC